MSKFRRKKTVYYKYTGVETVPHTIHVQVMHNNIHGKKDENI